MPFNKGSSKKPISKNVKTEAAAPKSKLQAIATAVSKAEKAKPKPGKK